MYSSFITGRWLSQERWLNRMTEEQIAAFSCVKAVDLLAGYFLCVFPFENSVLESRWIRWAGFKGRRGNKCFPQNTGWNSRSEDTVCTDTHLWENDVKIRLKLKIVVMWAGLNYAARNNSNDFSFYIWNLYEVSGLVNCGNIYVIWMTVYQVFKKAEVFQKS
jgi:hypothetical protein